MTRVGLTLFEAGHCLHPGFVVAGGAGLRPLRFPALVALLEHPAAGPVLFDTGYAPRVIDATRRLPYSLYRRFTPMRVAPGEAVVDRLAARGIAPGDVRHIVLSHFHADHVGGLRDFPAATVHATTEAVDSVRGLAGLAAVRRAHLPALLPDDLDDRLDALTPDRLRPTPDALGLETDGYDVLRDGSLWGVPLPGHAAGQIGLAFLTAREPVLLLADAVWLSATIDEGAMPNPLARLVTPDPAAWRRTVDWLRALARRRPDVRLVPSHCPASIAAARRAHA